MDDADARTRLLDAAEDLFYARGIQSVGIDAIRDASGVPPRRPGPPRAACWPRTASLAGRPPGAAGTTGGSAAPT
jgi:hypothetical protein